MMAKPVVQTDRDRLELYFVSLCVVLTAQCGLYFIPFMCSHREKTVASKKVLGFIYFYCSARLEVHLYQQ